LAHLCAESTCADDELVARVGGEEFAVLLPGCNLREARSRADALRLNVEMLAMPHRASTIAGHVTVSIGVSVVSPGTSQDSDVLMATSDRALYRAKNSGRNRVVARTVPVGLLCVSRRFRLTDHV
jgi:diguanylate cyclase (GGDEF)-like protein